METIENLLQSKTLTQRSKDLSKNLMRFSERQKTEMEKFKAYFPNDTDVIAKFSPQYWPNVIQNVEGCVNAPSVMLRHLDTLYNNKGLAAMIVKGNIIGIYSMSMASYQYKDESMNMTSEMFVARYGGELGMYAMLLYFANYITEYKSSYNAFDMQDVLIQCGRKFMPWWRGKIGSLEQEEKKPVSGLVGREAKIAMLGSRLISGATVDDLRNCNLFKFGYANEQDLQDAIEYAQNNF